MKRFGAGTTSLAGHYPSHQDCLRQTLHTMHFNKVFVMFRDEPYALRQAVDQHRRERDILRQKRHDKAAAKCF
ncbi:hypothetical protein [Glaciimonas sp. PCH181]|uniref:hypothetical protein n=1 Tax=Glaciimonas sp. PCH181 TaxID=2133943 RepID=UPI000D37F6BB|nr:hypothetical protein [Glaciimonas sp. PCH181]PUA18446.1 hypothetical protein C7W93_00295 [Glaciimonas sp. PCH181]